MTALTKEQRNAWKKLKDPDFGRELNDNPSVIREIRKAHKLGNPTPLLVAFMYKMANHMLNRPNFKPYSYRDDMVQYAMLMMMNSWKKFDETKSPYPTEYFKQVIKSAAIQYICREKKHVNIKEDLLERAANGQVD